MVKLDRPQFISYKANLTRSYSIPTNYSFQLQDYLLYRQATTNAMSIIATTPVYVDDRLEPSIIFPDHNQGFRKRIYPAITLQAINRAFPTLVMSYFLFIINDSPFVCLINMMYFNEVQLLFQPISTKLASIWYSKLFLSIILHAQIRWIYICEIQITYTCVFVQSIINCSINMW